MTQYSQRGIIFFLILMIFLAIAYALFFFGNWLAFFTQNVLWLFLLVAFFVFFWKFELLKLKDYERAVIFRFGKLNRVGGPGWTIILPFVESYQHVDLRTKTLDVERQDTVTKDSIEIKIDAVIYLKVRKDNQSVINSVLEVEDFQTASRTFVVSSIRDIIGGMELATCISKIDQINQRLKKDLATVTDQWGVNVIAVQIKDLDIPKTVLDAMHLQKAAVQEKLGRIEKAAARKAEITAVKEAAETLSDRALNYYYIKALEGMSHGKGTKLVFPLQFSNLAQSIGNKLTGEQSNEKTVKLIRQALKENVSKAVDKAKKERKK